MKALQGIMPKPETVPPIILDICLALSALCVLLAIYLAIRRRSHA